MADNFEANGALDQKLRQIVVHRKDLSFEEICGMDSTQCLDMIVNRYPLKAEQLFTDQIPKNDDALWNRHEVAKLALFRLEGVRLVACADFYTNEFNKLRSKSITESNKIISVKNITTRSNEFFSRSLKNAIKTCTRIRSERTTRMIRDPELKSLVEQACAATKLTPDQLFSKTRNLPDNASFSSTEIVQTYLWRIQNDPRSYMEIVRASRPKIHESDISWMAEILKTLVNAAFSQEARGFLPRNVNKSTT